MFALMEWLFRILFAFLNNPNVKIFGFKIWGIKAFMWALGMWVIPNCSSKNKLQNLLSNQLIFPFIFPVIYLPHCLKKKVGLVLILCNYWHELPDTNTIVYLFDITSWAWLLGCWFICFCCFPKDASSHRLEAWGVMNTPLMRWSLCQGWTVLVRCVV